MQRQVHRQTGAEKGTQADRCRDRYSGRQQQRQVHRQTGADRYKVQTGAQTGTQADSRQAGAETDT